MGFGEDPFSAIDTTVPNAARVYDVFLGGKDNFLADREAAQVVMEAYPWMREAARENRRFLGRAVRYVAAQGVRQFLDIGAGLPTAENTHEIARRVAPDARVVYADNDPMVLVHARALLATDGQTTVINGDLREPGAILADPDLRAAIDFTRPVAVLLVAILHFIPNTNDPAGIIATLMNAVAPGSYLILSHATDDFTTRKTAAKARSAYQQAPTPLVLRSHAEIRPFVAGLDVVEPGLVRIPEWRPNRRPAHPERIWGYAAVARRP